MRLFHFPPPPEARAAAPPRRSRTRHQPPVPLARRRHHSGPIRQIAQQRHATWECRYGRGTAAPRAVADDGLAPAGNFASCAATPCNLRALCAARRTTTRPRGALDLHLAQAAVTQPNSSNAMPCNVRPVLRPLPPRSTVAHAILPNAMPHNVRPRPRCVPGPPDQPTPCREAGAACTQPEQLPRMRTSRTQCHTT